MQCMATAMTAGAAATGGRVWLAAHSPSWMTPRRLKAATAALLAIAVLAAGSNFAPNGSDAGAKAATPASASAQR
jgi:hypothetical protein